MRGRGRGGKGGKGLRCKRGVSKEGKQEVSKGEG